MHRVGSETIRWRGIERRPQVRDDTTPIRYEQLHALWTRADVHIRDKTLWRMLYETAARTNEILALNVEDLDMATRHRDHHRQGRPPPGGRVGVGNSPGAAPDTGRGRLSYQSARTLFKKASGWTLHDLRQAALTHLAEEGISALMLKAKSRHQSLRSRTHR